jgi:regulator of sigma E protease
VILAGVTMNILLAFFIFAGLFAVDGVPVPATTQVDTVVAHTVPPGTEGLTELRRGDRIIRVNGDTVNSWLDLQEKLFKSDGAARVEIQGRPEPIVIRLPEAQELRARALGSIRPYVPARIGMVYPGEPGARGGLKPGDVVIRIDGDSVRSWNDVQFKLWKSPGKTLPFTVQRDTALVNLTVTPRPETETDSTSPRPPTFGFIGAEGDIPEVKQPLPFGRAVAAGAVQTVRQGELVIKALGRLVRGKGLRELGGPITIAQVSGQAARLGLDRFLSVLAIISVGLAILNLLPIPVLDGGHAMFLIAEGIRRKPLSAQLRLRLTQVGMLIVFAIMIIALSNDVIRNIR